MDPLGAKKESERAQLRVREESRDAPYHLKGPTSSTASAGANRDDGPVVPNVERASE